MNEKIVDVLRISDEPDKLYAAQYIENLKTSREILRSNYLLIAGAGAKESDGPEHIADIIRNTRLERDQLKARVTQLEEQQRWIPVSERLPEDQEFVIILYKGVVDVTSYHADGFAHTFDHVTHWQELPQPPESEGE